MNRAGYSEDYEIGQWSLIMWRGAVASAIRGRRGQAFLRELRDALDAMPEKKLIAHDLKNECGVCAIGSVGERRGVNLTALDPDDYTTVAGTFGVAEALVREIEYENDEGTWLNETPEARWRRMRDWVEQQIKDPK